MGCWRGGRIIQCFGRLTASGRCSSIPSHSVAIHRQNIRWNVNNSHHNPTGLDLPPMCLRSRLRNADHALKKRKRGGGKWNHTRRCFNVVTSKCVHLRCHECQKQIRTYCACDPLMPLCTGCHTLHCQELE